MSNWYPSVYKAFIYASIVVFILGFFTDAKGSYAAYLAGYSLLTLGIMMILVVLFSKIMGNNPTGSTSQLISSIMMSTGPFILMLGIIAFVLFMLIKYKNNIIDGHVAPSYNAFSNIIIILILVQIYLVITNLNIETTGKMSKVISSTMYLLGVLSAISSITLYTILKYYSTDGFISFHKSKEY